MFRTQKNKIPGTPNNDEDDDPRPHKYRKRPSYQDEVNNKTVNFTYKSGIDITWRYTFRKADLRAAMMDHDYLPKPFGFYQVKQSNMVTIDEANKIEKLTRGQASSNMWKEERKWRLTASKFGDICKATGIFYMDTDIFLVP